MTEITVNPDQSLSVRWAGKKGRGSLYQIMAEGNATEVNKLSRGEMVAVMLAVKHLPFPLGQGRTFYRDCLKTVQDKGIEALFVSKISDGELRKYLVSQAGGGCNAPWDSYISIAVAVKENAHDESHSY